MLTAKEAASRARISLSLLYELCREGRLKHKRVGRRGKRGKYLIDEADLADFLKVCEAESVPPLDDGDLKWIR